MQQKKNNLCVISVAENEAAVTQSGEKTVDVPNDKNEDIDENKEEQLAEMTKEEERKESREGMEDVKNKNREYKRS